MINAALLEATNADKEMPPSVFLALDPRLPRVAALASVEFDWLIQGKHGKAITGISQDSINLLSLLLSQSIGKTPVDQNEKAFVDSLGLNLFAKAYNETNKAHPVKTREELMVAIKDLTNTLRKIQQKNEIDEAALISLRDFCAALSEYAAAYRNMIYGNPQEHPYRK